MDGRLSERWRRAVSSLKESGLRVAFMRSELLRRGLPDVARALDNLCSDAEQADPGARDVLGAVVPVLSDPVLAERVMHLREAAAAGALLPLSRLLRQGARRHGLLHEPHVDERMLATSSSGRVLTLGER